MEDVKHMFSKAAGRQPNRIIFIFNGNFICVFFSEEQNERKGKEMSRYKDKESLISFF